MTLSVEERIGILADAAKYDASCSTSGSARKNSPGGLGSGAPAGICHAWSSDGRCVALLKVLLSNVCAYDCAYCVNRRSSDVPRSSFDPDELARLVVEFYRRNYIEGVFLSSGVIGCPDATMERLVEVARRLRLRDRFNGYIHMKVIPGCSDFLVLQAARFADRVSVNIELPSAASLADIAPDKTPESIFRPMRTLARASGFEPRRLPPPAIAVHGSVHAAGNGDSLPDRRFPPGFSPPPPDVPSPVRRTPDDSISVMDARMRRRRDPSSPVLPAGQTTQMVVGASPESDAQILALAENLYLAYDVRRVYYSAFIGTQAHPRMGSPRPPPLAREHRLYQADWLFRFYGFAASDILDADHPDLDIRMDPKCSWALRNLHRFPVDPSRAEYAELLRVPGIGPVSASRILNARREGRLSERSLSRLGVVMKRARWFLAAGGGGCRFHDDAGALPGPAGTGAAGPSPERFGLRRDPLSHPELLRRFLEDRPRGRDSPDQPELPWEDR
jgi:putative DNA modification/repair radical SAM protein